MTGLLKKVSVFELFLTGARKGLRTSAELIPTWIGLLTAVAMLRSSGLLDNITDMAGILLKNSGFPTELLPVLIVRLFSSGAATGLTVDLFKQYGPDSVIGLMASIFMSCTETYFYTVSVYLSAVHNRNGRYIWKGAMLATAVGTMVTILLVTYL